MVEAEPVRKRLDHRNQGVALMDVALEYLVTDGVAAHGHQQAQEYLWIAVAAFLGEATNAKVILVRGLEVQSRHVIENHAHLAAKNPQRLGKAYLLHLMLDAAALCGAEAVYKPIYTVHRLVHMEVAAQVPNRLELAARAEQTTHHQMAEHLVVDGIVAPGSWQAWT